MLIRLLLGGKKQVAEKLHSFNSQLNKVSNILILLAGVFTSPLAAQQKPDTSRKRPDPDNSFLQMLDYSRPSRNHQLLLQLVGVWAFQDKDLPFVKGSIVRKAIYDGRFFLVDIKGGKLQSPVAKGKMKEENYQALTIEGYDNVKKMFVSASISNHIGSDISLEEGTYDSTKRAFTYKWQSELVPGMEVSNRKVVTVLDKDHYREEYYEEQNGIEQKTRMLLYTRKKTK